MADPGASGPAPGQEASTRKAVTFSKERAEGTLERCKADMELLAELEGDSAYPSAVILSCSDSRVPPEIIFDQGLGDMYVVRVSGNVTNDFVLGSCIWAVTHLSCRLVMVLGHTKCSTTAQAVSTSIQTMLSPDREAAATLEGNGRSQGARSSSSGSAKDDESPSRPRSGLLSCLCANGGEAREANGAAHAPAAESSSEQRSERSVDMHRGSRRNSDQAEAGKLHRTSVNPLERVRDAIGHAVENVAQQGGETFKGIHKPEWAEDEETLKKGLQKKDSLEFTRARLQRQRADGKIDALRRLASRGDVTSVIEENAKLSASTILKGLVKHVDDPELVSECVVVAASFDLATGKVAVLNRGWFSGRNFYYE